MSDRRPDAAGQAAHPALVPHAALRTADALGVFALALGLRVWHLLALRRSPFFDVLMGDSLGYDAWARRIAAGDWLGSEVFYQAPLYPYFLAAVYSAVSDDLMVVRLAQALLGSLSCLLLALAGARFLKSRAAGIAAGAILALYAPAIFHDGLIQKSALDLFWLCGLLWVLSRIQDEPRALLGWAAGGCLGALTLTRENAGVLLLPVALWLWIHFRPERKLRVALVAALLAGLATVLLPVALRNSAIDGGFHLTTSQFGSNFYYGNNANSNGTYQSLRFAHGDPRYESSDAEALAEQALGRELTPGEVSDYWASQAFDYIASEPMAWLGLMGRKIVLLLNATEIIDTEDQYTYAKWSPAVRLSGAVLHFGVLAPLAFVGLLVSWNRRERLWLLYLMAPTYASSVLLFYVVARYRLPLVPFFALAAAPALVEARSLPARVAALPRSAVAAMAIGFCALAILCNGPITDRAGMAAATYYNLGIAMHTQGDDEAALVHYQSALEIVPDYSEALWAAGISFSAREETKAAIESYRTAIALRPDVAAIHLSLAGELSKSGDVEGAARHYREALVLEPDLATAHFQLAIALAMTDRAVAGRSHAERAVALDPSLLTRLSEVAWRRATKRGVGQRRSPDGTLALLLARWSADLTQPPTPRSLDVLAASFAAAGNFSSASRVCRKAIRLAMETGNSQLAIVLHHRLALYQKNKPFVRGK